MVARLLVPDDQLRGDLAAVRGAWKANAPDRRRKGYDQMFCTGAVPGCVVTPPRAGWTVPVACPFSMTVAMISTSPLARDRVRRGQKRDDAPVGARRDLVDAATMASGRREVPTAALCYQRRCHSLMEFTGQGSRLCDGRAKLVALAVMAVLIRRCPCGAAKLSARRKPSSPSAASNTSARSVCL